MANIIVAALAGGVACGIALAWALLPAMPLGGPLASLAPMALALVALAVGIRHRRQPAPPPMPRTPPDQAQEIGQLLAALDRLHRSRLSNDALQERRPRVEGE